MVCNRVQLACAALVIPVLEDSILFHSGCTFLSESVRAPLSPHPYQRLLSFVSVMTLGEMTPLCHFAFNRVTKKLNQRTFLPSSWKAMLPHRAAGPISKSGSRLQCAALLMQEGSWWENKTVCSLG